MAEKDFKPLEVYCAETKEYISPGAFEICPYYGGENLEFERGRDPIAQVFRCHVKCGCRIAYRYRSGDEIVTKHVDEVADLEGLRAILAGVLEGGGGSRDQGDSGQRKILMVDDDMEYAELISSALATRGFQVEIAHSADDAVAAVTAQRPDLLVLDVMMEHFDSGFALSKRIREDFGHIPTIFFSAIGRETGLDFEPKSDEQRGRLHADAFLDKDATVDELVEKIRELLSSGEEP
jgi:two-component system alkaline phosphatase synthesis response regulator PhoP